MARVLAKVATESLTFAEIQIIQKDLNILLLKQELEGRLQVRTAISLTSSILTAQFRILILEFNEVIDYQLLNFFIIADSSGASSQCREQ